MIIAQLTAYRDRLTAAIDALSSPRVVAPVPASAAPAPPSPKRKRKPRVPEPTSGGHENRNRILDLLRDRPPQSVDDIAHALKLEYANVYYHLKRLLAEGHVQKTGKEWRLAA